MSHLSAHAYETSCFWVRSTCNAIEKKLEACVKEKAVQDRLIRENQDALQDLSAGRHEPGG